jgi:hypothetical protein
MKSAKKILRACIKGSIAWQATQSEALPDKASILSNPSSLFSAAGTFKPSLPS